MRYAMELAIGCAVAAICSLAAMLNPTHLLQLQAALTNIIKETM